MSVAEKLYFAYGSNINLGQMAHRCPDAQMVGPVTLAGYELRFRSNIGGYGVATITPKRGSQVPGLLWRITPACEQSLDRYEGYPRLYGKETVTVRDRAGQSYTVMAYIMTERYREPALPSNLYYSGILEGYRQNGLPTASLKLAWTRTVREAHRRMEQINKQFTRPARTPKGRGGHER